MLALIESMTKNDLIVISATDDNRLREQIEKILHAHLSSTAWARLYVEMETIDTGNSSITLFESDSILNIKPLPNPPAVIRVDRDVHNLKPLNPNPL